MLKSAVLRADAEPQVMAALHPARRVRNAEHVLGGALGDAAFPVSAESLDREARTAVVDWICSPRKVAKADVAHPITVVQADRTLNVIGVVVAEPHFVHDGGRNDPRFAHSQVPAPLGHIRDGEGAWTELRAVVPHEPPEQILLLAEHFVRPDRRRVRVVGEIFDDAIVVHAGIVRRGNRRSKRLGELREAPGRDHIAGEWLPGHRVHDGRGER